MKSRPVQAITRSSIVTVLLAFMLVAPQAESSAEAGIYMKVEEPTLIAFGTAGTDLFWDNIISVAIDFVPLYDRYTPFGGELTFRSDTLLSLIVTDDGFGSIYSHYEFGPGTARITASWDVTIGGGPDSISGSGEWNGELLGVTFDIEETSPFGPEGDVFATFGAGIFDASFASILGVPRRTTGGSFQMTTDRVDGDPSSPRRIGGSQHGVDDLYLDPAGPSPVPEPQTWSLLLTGVASLLAWRCRSRGASRTTR
jgi:hypothetical protein